MKITVFTSNQVRHVSLIEDLASIADEVFAVQECNTLFPGKTEDFYRKSDVMKNYFSRVIQAERTVFGESRFSPANVKSISMKMGDLRDIDLDNLKDALCSDIYVVSGSSFIKSPLIDVLVEKGAYNLHVGVSPYYRGSACNFWACYDGRHDYVGATIHMLTRGLDSGPMLFHTFPELQDEDGPFEFTMRSVKAAYQGFVHALANGTLHDYERIPQDKSLEIRYSRVKDFNDKVATDFLSNLPTREDMEKGLALRDFDKFLHPFVF